ncbi:peptidase family M28 [Diplocarpon rosae]|nr:peptidase family M28 [Diplocarpon rosae]
MHFIQHLGAFAAFFPFLVSAALMRDEVMEAKRLVKTRPDDIGTTVREVEKYRNAGLVTFGFIDIQDISDSDVLNALSGVEGAPIERQTWKYPKYISHFVETTFLIESIELSHPEQNLWELTSRFYNRYYDGEKGFLASEWLFEKVKSITEVNPAIHLRKHHHSWMSPTIIVTIPGNSDDLVIVGANYDSVGSYGSYETAPGADANGSGTVTILEALRVLANAGFRPERTIEFHFYSGTTGGLRGSGEIFKIYKAAKKNVYAFLNVAMTGFLFHAAPVIFTDNTNADLNNFLYNVISRYTGYEARLSSCGRYYGCSDHISASSNGFPAALISGRSGDKWDTLRNTEFDTFFTIERFSIGLNIQIALAFLVEASYDTLIDE